jgi:hypothetical protein
MSAATEERKAQRIEADQARKEEHKRQRMSK